MVYFFTILFLVLIVVSILLSYREFKDRQGLKELLDRCEANSKEAFTAPEAGVYRVTNDIQPTGVALFLKPGEPVAVTVKQDEAVKPKKKIIKNKAKKTVKTKKKIITKKSKKTVKAKKKII